MLGYWNAAVRCWKCRRLIVPESANLLVNPARPDAASARIVGRRRFVFDRRLWLPL
jgi:hypothetical protein